VASDFPRNIDQVPIQTGGKNTTLLTTIDDVNTRTRTTAVNYDWRNPIFGAEPSSGGDTDIAGGRITADATIPRKSEAPDAWKWNVVANATVIKSNNADQREDPLPEGVTRAASGIASARARGNSKFGSIKAYATAFTQGDGAQTSLAEAAGRARPGGQYRAVVVKSDSTAISTNDDVAVGSYATGNAGQGIVVSSARGFGQAGTSAAGGGKAAIVDTAATANANRWYMAPGHAIGGTLTLSRGGSLDTDSENRVRADLGTATSGALMYARADGNLPVAVPRIRNAIIQSNDNAARVDAGNSAAGTINIGITQGGRVQLINDDTSAQSAVGNAIAGSLLLGYSENDRVRLGDYDVWDDATEDSTTAVTRGRGAAQAGQINIALAPDGETRILADVGASAEQASAVAGAMNLANSWNTASIDSRSEARTSEYNAISGNIGLAQSQERSVSIINSKATTGIGSALAYGLSNAVIGEQTSATTNAEATSKTGQAAALSASQSLAGVTAQGSGGATAETGSGNALALSSTVSGAAFTGRGSNTVSATAATGAALAAGGSVALGGDTVASSAATSETTTGNAAAAGVAASLGVIQGKANVAVSSKSETGSSGALGVGVATGIAQAQSAARATSETADGNSQALAGSLAVSGVNAISSAKAESKTDTGDSTATAQSVAVGVFHGESRAAAKSSTGCVDCVSDAVANSIATGFIADSEAKATADSDKNPGNALANAMSFGAISRVANAGAARVAVGPAQALTGGFAVSGSKKTTIAAANAARAGTTAAINVRAAPAANAVPKPAATNAAKPAAKNAAPAKAAPAKAAPAKAAPKPAPKPASG
jgi:hypothetical protein